MTHSFPFTLAGALLALLLSLAATAEEILYYENREDIPEQYTWDLGLQFETVEDWEKAFAAVEAKLPELETYRGKVGASASNIAEALDKQFELWAMLGPVYIHPSQKNDLDRNDSEAAGQAGRAAGLMARLTEATSFIEPEIAAIPEREAKRYLSSEELEAYAHYLDNIWRLRDHYRSAEVEEVIAGSSLSGRGHREAYGNLNDADITWPTIKDENREDVVVSPGQFFRFQQSIDRDLRRRSFEAHLATIESYKNTFGATLGGKVQRDVWLARVYRYPSSLEAALSSTNVPAEVIETLVSTVHDNVDKIQGYADLRRRILGLDELHPWDSHVSLLPDGGRKYTFDEAWELAMTFWMETFGEEFAAIAQEALDRRWVDVYTNKGKSSGAYSWGSYRAPYYLLLNWSGEFEDVSILVHEMGHSVHGVLADRNQAYHDANSDLFVAEVASVASESLFTEWMLERTRDPAERKLLLDHSLTSIRNTFVTQIFFHEFEAKMHAMAEAGEALTAESLGQAYVDLHTLYNGDSIVPNDFTAVYWARIDHFFRNFYVWKYATSFAAGEALAARFRSGDKTAAEDYMRMLRLGGSLYPLDVLKAGGVDMTDPTVIRAVMERFGQLQTQLEKEFGL